MTLACAPRAARRLGLLALLFLALPWLALTLAVLEGLRRELGAADPALAAAAAALPLGLPVAGFIAAECMAYLLGSRLLLPAGVLAQVAEAAAAQDYRRAPRPGQEDEMGRLATAFGRLIRHLTRRRRELDWMAGDIATHGLVAGAGDRARHLLASLAQESRFAAEDPEPAEAWLNAPLHRLLCALAGCVAVLAAAPLGLDWAAAIAAAALIGGRLAEPLRRLGATVLAVAVVAALSLWLLTEAEGHAMVVRALAAALAAGVAVHLGGGWRGPAGGTVDAGWLRGGLAGALAGGGVAAALAGLLGIEAAAAVGVPLLLVGLGLAAICLAPGAAVATPADWPGAHAALSLLRLAAVRRKVLGGALPGGFALGTAVALAMSDPHLAVAAAVLGSVLLAMPVLRVRISARAGRLAAAGLLAGAAPLTGLLDSLALSAPLAPALLTTLAAVLAWPGATPDCTGGTVPRQVATLAALLRSLGVVLALAGMVLLPPGFLPALAGLALLPALLPARWS